MSLWVTSAYGLAEAWEHSRGFVWETVAAVTHHLPVLLAVSIIPAALRAYFILKERRLPQWEANLAEALLTVWRVLICVVAIWATLTPMQWRTFKLRLHDADDFQLAMQRTGAHLGRSLHLLFWELLLFAIAFWSLYAIISLIARLTARIGDPEHRVRRSKAFGSILRNLILAPLALIYLVAILRQAFS